MTTAIDLALDRMPFEAVGRSFADLETPVPIIDVAIVERNLRRWQQRCDAAKFANRPHIKTHKLVPLAKAQLALGAKGICVQKLGEAEVMADAGISDILLTYNVVGAPKIARLAALAKRTEIAVVADSDEVVAGIAEAGAAAGRPIRVLVECDAGAGRNGVQSPEAALRLAQAIDRRNSVRFGGLMFYTRSGIRRAIADFMAEAKARCEASGLPVETISTGGSPEMWNDEGLAGITEYRAGTYIYYDRALIAAGACTLEDCAIRVVSTVVSRPTGERAIIDAGSKALTSDLLGLEGYGIVPELAGAKVYNVNEEHGYLGLGHLPAAQRPRVGDLVQVLPNHACPVSNLFDKVVFVRGSEVLGALPVDARGKVH
jgi:D-serine deaminase-like pyridoxal phosphate-dependent protein